MGLVKDCLSCLLRLKCRSNCHSKCKCSECDCNIEQNPPSTRDSKSDLNKQTKDIVFI